MTNLFNLSSIVAGSAAAGFGFGGGRSLWRWFERHSTTIFAIALISAGSGLAGFYLRSSETEGIFRRIFVVLLPAIILILVSLFACFAFAGLLGVPGVAKKLCIWQGIAFVIGLIAAQPVRNEQRKIREMEQEATEIAAANQSFLKKHGLRELGGKHRSMSDELGREIIVDDVRTDAIVFKVKGRRGVRSKILLSENGRMIAYEPAPLNSKEANASRGFAGTSPR